MKLKFTWLVLKVETNAENPTLYQSPCWY